MIFNFTEVTGWWGALAARPLYQNDRIVPAAGTDKLIPARICASKRVAMDKIHHEIKIKAPQDLVFDALITVHGLSGWHSSEVDGALGPSPIFWHGFRR